MPAVARKRVAKKLRTETNSTDSDTVSTSTYHEETWNNINGRSNSSRDMDQSSDTHSEPEVDFRKKEQAFNRISPKSEWQKGVTGDRVLDFEPPACQVNLDIIQITLFCLALVTRLYRISFPRAVVFDELHYTKFIRMYLNNTFFFDVHPPLVKMMYASVGYLSGYSVDDGFNKIGEVYPDTVPIVALRSVPAVLNCLTVPIMYQVFIELRLSKWAATIAALSVLLENSMLTQSRVLMAESPLVFMLALTVLSCLKFRNKHQFTFQWWTWLVLLCACIATSLLVKYISIMTFIFVAVILGYDWWNELGHLHKDLNKILLSAIAQLTCVIVITIAIYMTVFYVHLSVLTKAGNHDHIMTSKFQASLEGGLRSITQGQPPSIAYGSQVTLRQAYGQHPCWLHSHQSVYPVRYKDGRGSSHQQQVTCYTHKDVNNWWLIKDPNNDALRVDDPIRPVQDGDVIELVHGMTKRKLNSHDVAAPKSPSMQEVSGYIDYNVSMAPRTFWKVDISNKESDGEMWTTIRSHVLLIHVNSSQILRITGKNLPEWGYNQLEVVTDKTAHDSSLWNVEEHKYTSPKDPKDKEPKDRDLIDSELIPTQSTRLGFWEKFTELQWKMLTKADKPLDHRFSSTPMDWLHGAGNVAYWLRGGSHTQIHLVGNLTLWVSALVGILIQGGIVIFFIISRAREACPYTDADWGKICYLCAFSVGGYLLHYLPFHMVEYTYFLYHYQPALLYKLMIVPCAFEMLLILSRRNFSVHLSIIVAAFVWMGLVAYNFVALLPLCYGSELNVEDFDALQWHPDWDFIVKYRTASGRLTEGRW